MGNPRNANGHRRRTLRKRLLARGGTCAWEFCPWPDEPLDPTLHHHDDKAPEVDELVPVSLGGNPLSRANTRLLHRYCNRERGNGTRAVKAPPQPVSTTRAW